MGRAEEDRREAGVGFAMKLSILSSLESLPRGVNDRLMVMRLPLQGKMYATIISAYAPIMTNEDEVLYRRSFMPTLSRFCQKCLAVISSFYSEISMLELDLIMRPGREYLANKALEK